MYKTYNKKKFLVPDSPRTMASYHAKVTDGGMMKLTIHDCKGSIQLWNDLTEKEQVEEAITKLKELEIGISLLRLHIQENY